MRGAADLHLVETPLPELLREVTGLAPVPSGVHVMLKAAGVWSTQRLALGDVAGGVVAFTWPAELQKQAEHVYNGERGPRLLEAARAGGWEVDTRPHLAFWRSSPDERLYTNPIPTMSAEEYVAAWAGEDGRRIGAHEADVVRSELWPWLLDRGYASREDERELEPFLDRLQKRKRPAHLRPGLRLLRRWGRDETQALRARGELASEIRSAVNHLLHAVDDPALPVPR